MEIERAVPKMLLELGKLDLRKCGAKMDIVNFRFQEENDK